ncbi:hypothetical protein EVG20_g4707 [Dentipellis fragilis]|uniref:Uncharacterized protein n=1 Tax=Dentipellis fragilis TaxID=205917 RepID=A0A4Y9YXB1_9AGAM|nr:hypothetical protein EVG20_g4707 [Dentipellis fragilis]
MISGRTAVSFCRALNEWCEPLHREYQREKARNEGLADKESGEGQYQEHDGDDGDEREGGKELTRSLEDRERGNSEGDKGAEVPNKLDDPWSLNNSEDSIDDTSISSSETMYIFLPGLESLELRDVDFGDCGPDEDYAALHEDIRDRLLDRNMYCSPMEIFVKNCSIREEWVEELLDNGIDFHWDNDEGLYREVVDDDDDDEHFSYFASNE